MKKNNIGVCIKVHPSFFNGWFEPKRKSYEQKLGIPIGQVRFTEIMAKKFKVKIPLSDNLFKVKKMRGIKFFI